MLSLTVGKGVRRHRATLTGLRGAKNFKPCFNLILQQVASKTNCNVPTPLGIQS